MTESLAPRERRGWREGEGREGGEGEEGEGLTAELDTDGEKEKESPMEIRRFLREKERKRAAAASINCNAARRQFKRRLFCAASANLQGGISDHQNMDCLSLSSADIDN